MENNTIVYTDEQKNFIKKLHNEIRRSQELWKKHVEFWGEQRGKTFFVDLNYFVRVVQYAMMNNELKLANKVLDKVFFIGAAPHYTDVVFEYIESVVKNFK